MERHVVKALPGRGWRGMNSETTHGAGWTDARIEFLKKMWAEGTSLSQIMRALGSGVTRNAVAGKVHRLGLEKRKKAASIVPPRPKAVKKDSDQITGSAVNRMVKKRKRAKIKHEAGLCDVVDDTDIYPDDLEIPLDQRKTLLELTDDTCRWPVGDPQSPDFFFCGGRVAEGKSYCACHMARAYRPPSDRRISERRIAYLNGEYRRKAA